MQQTILAIGALLIIMTTAMLYQRSNMLSQELAYIRQIEIAAEDAAKMRLEGLATLAFDEGLVGTTGLPAPGDYSLLTSPLDFGLDGGEVTPDDLDDYHGRLDTISHVVSTDSFWFAISYSVRYLTTTGDSTLSPTELKELTANIQSLTPIGNRTVNGNFTRLSFWSENHNP